MGYYTGGRMRCSYTRGFLFLFLSAFLTAQPYRTRYKPLSHDDGTVIGSRRLACRGTGRLVFSPAWE